MNVLDWMVPPASFMATSHLESLVKGVNPLYCQFLPHVPQGEIVYIKGANGFPWDINTFDDQYVYQNITEGPNGWTDPTSYKKFASESTKNGGILWSPLILTTPSMPLISDSTYNTWQSGKLVSTQNLGGNVSTKVEGPYNLFVGKLGIQSVLVLSYQWGNSMEVNWYAHGYGWCRWQLWLQSGDSYILQTDDLFDQVTPGGTPTLVFPGVIP